MTARRKRPKTCKTYTPRFNTLPKKTYIVLNEDTDGNLIRVFVVVGKTGDEARAYCDALSITISLALQYGTPPENLARHLKGIMGGTPTFDIQWGKTPIKSVPDAVGRAIEWWIQHKEESNENDTRNA